MSFSIVTFVQILLYSFNLCITKRKEIYILRKVKSHIFKLIHLSVYFIREINCVEFLRCKIQTIKLKNFKDKYKFSDERKLFLLIAFLSVLAPPFCCNLLQAFLILLPLLIPFLLALYAYCISSCL